MWPQYTRLTKVVGSSLKYFCYFYTGVRDYIHVVDLAQGHVAAVRKLDEGCGFKVYNLGTGQGYSVLEMVKAFEKASGKKVSTLLIACYNDKYDCCAMGKLLHVNM